LSGVNPFQGKNLQEMLAKNKECNITFSEPCWNLISEEACDLAKKMLSKDPIDRPTAKKALSHNWFTMEHISNYMLSDAFENISKHQNENRFNVEKIKPEFSMITCSPFECLSSKVVKSRESAPLVINFGALKSHIMQNEEIKSVFLSGNMQFRIKLQNLLVKKAYRKQ